MKNSALAAIAGATVLGCGSDLGPRMETPSRVPGASTAYQVTARIERGPYLDAVLERPGEALRFFFPADATCREVVAVESSVQYKAVSVLGSVENGLGVCQSVGIGSLATWRDRRPRQTKQVVPRGRAEFSTFYQDADITLIQGRFPYANQIGWVGGWDSLAAVPRSDVCDGVVGAGRASLEFRTAGRDPYRLLHASGYCPILAFVKPLPRHDDELRDEASP